MNDDTILPKPELSTVQDDANTQNAQSLPTEGDSVSLGGSSVLAASDIASAQNAVSQAAPDDQNTNQDATDPTMPLTAEDVDLIEKEWVLKAKQAVHSTIGDPRKQSSQLDDVKRHYQQKRFNREIPKSE